MTTTTREIYHAVRRAGTQHSYCPTTGKHYIRREHTATALRRAAVPRGCGKRRDEIARRLADLRTRTAEHLPLSRRYDRYLVALYSAVIEARGGEIEIDEESRTIGLRVIDRRDGLVLLGCDGWRHYSRRFGARRASLRYLCGTDDNGRWAVRVHGNIDTIGRALDFVEPAEVQRARSEGRRILRQGDVYLVEQARDNFAALAGTRHYWDASSRTLHHDDPDAPHGALHVPYRAKAIVQSVLRMGRSGGRRRGD